MILFKNNFIYEKSLFDEHFKIRASDPEPFQIITDPNFFNNWIRILIFVSSKGGTWGADSFMGKIKFYHCCVDCSGAAKFWVILCFIWERQSACKQRSDNAKTPQIFFVFFNNVIVVKLSP